MPRATRCSPTPRMAQMLGRTPEEMPGLSVFETPRRGRAGAVRRPPARARDQSRDRQQPRVQPPAQGRRTVLGAGQPHPHQGRRRRARRLAAPRHRVQPSSGGSIDTLQRREAQLAEAQHIAKIGSWEWDVVSDRVTWSDELYRVYGVDPSDGSRRTTRASSTRMHPDDRARVARGGRRGPRRPTDEFEFDARIFRAGRDDRVDPRRGAGSARDEPAPSVRMGGTSQDITATKDAEQALALLTAMATAANEATSLAEVVPTIRRATSHGIPDGSRGCLPGRRRRRPRTRRRPTRTVADADPAGAARAGPRRGRHLRPQVSRTTEGTSLVAAPVVAEGRAACVIVHGHPRQHPADRHATGSPSAGRPRCSPASPSASGPASGWSRPATAP